jgi:hypothetical protein
MPNFMKIRPVGAEFHTDGRTDMTQLIVAFRKFANAPKNIDWLDYSDVSPLIIIFFFQKLGIFYVRIAFNVRYKTCRCCHFHC